MRYFAIGGKDFIEIREALKPPRKIVTTASRVIKQPSRRPLIGYDLYGNPCFHRTPAETVKRTIRSVIFKGGKAIKFLRQLPPFPPPPLGEMIELTPEQAKALGVG